MFFATCGEVLTVRRTGDDLVFLSFVHTLATSAEDAEFYEVVLQGLTGIMDRVVSGSEKNDEASDSADCVTAYITAID